MPWADARDVYKTSVFFLLRHGLEAGAAGFAPALRSTSIGADSWAWPALNLLDARNRLAIILVRLADQFGGSVLPSAIKPEFEAIRKNRVHEEVARQLERL